MTTTTRKPINFSTKADAEQWLRDTGNFGFIHSAYRGYIIVQSADGAMWAFTAADEMVHLPEW
jgi:hypothetical protein